jgi:hypothetical protein
MKELKLIGQRVIAFGCALGTFAYFNTESLSAAILIGVVYGVSISLTTTKV